MPHIHRVPVEILGDDYHVLRFGAGFRFSGQHCASFFGIGELAVALIASTKVIFGGMHQLHERLVTGMMRW